MTLHWTNKPPKKYLEIDHINSIRDVKTDVKTSEKNILEYT